MLSIEDRVAINELLARYYLANDNKDVNAALACCTPDATIDGDFTMSSDQQEEDLERIYQGEPGLKRHLMLNPIVLEVSEEQVSMQHMMLVVEASVFPKVIATSKVHDIFKKVESEWKIHVHTIEIDPSGKWIVKIGKGVQSMIESLKQKFS